MGNTYVFFADLCLFFGREIVLDIEQFSDLFGCFSLDHIGTGGGKQSM